MKDGKNGFNYWYDREEAEQVKDDDEPIKEAKAVTENDSKKKNEV